MKKKNLKSLSLNKKSISLFSISKFKGGTDRPTIVHLSCTPRGCGNSYGNC